MRKLLRLKMIRWSTSTAIKETSASFLTEAASVGGAPAAASFTTRAAVSVYGNTFFPPLPSWKNRIYGCALLVHPSESCSTTGLTSAAATRKQVNIIQLYPSTVYRYREEERVCVQTHAQVCSHPCDDDHNDDGADEWEIESWARKLANALRVKR